MWIRPALTLIAAILIGVAACDPPVGKARDAGGASDVETQWALAARMRSGESYYEAAGRELRQHSYPTQSIFNWRTPLLLTAVAAVPSTVSRAALLGLGIVLCVATLVVLEPARVAAMALIAQLGTAMMIGVASAVVLGETWAGALIALSLCAYITRRDRLAVALAVVALFLRELAIVHCAASALVALRPDPERRSQSARAIARRWFAARRPELIAWCIGAGLYALYFTWHAIEVSAHRQPTDLAHTSSWLQFGGVPFLVATARWQAWSLILPAWAMAAALVPVVAGILDPRTPLHVRSTAAAYVIFFLAVGQAFNDYWGLIAWPTWALAFGYGVDAVGRDLNSVVVALGARRSKTT